MGLIFPFFRLGAWSLLSFAFSVVVMLSLETTVLGFLLLI